MGFKELYPFFHWKLYTQPLGNTNIVYDYRIYGISKNNDTIRLKNKGYKYLNQDDYYYFLSNEAQKVKSKEFSNSYLKNRLKSFGSLIDSNYVEYLIIEEEFDPMTINSDSKIYKPKIILSSK